MGREVLQLMWDPVTNAVVGGKGRDVAVSPLRGQNSGGAWGIPLPTWPQGYKRELRKNHSRKCHTKFVLEFSMIFSVPAGLPQGTGCTTGVCCAPEHHFWGGKKEKEERKKSTI